MLTQNSINLVTTIVTEIFARTVGVRRVFTRPAVTRPDPTRYVVNFKTRPDPTRKRGNTRKKPECKILTRNDPTLDKL